MRVFEAVITDYSDFGKVVFRRFYHEEPNAYGNGREMLDNFRDADPEYADSYELRVHSYEVH